MDFLTKKSKARLTKKLNELLKFDLAKFGEVKKTLKV